jgi:putative DNA-invertase from lambdoid prophage Rac
VITDLKDGSIRLHMIDLGGDLTDDGISKLMFTILSTIAEAQRARIRERISVVKADQKARGAYLGGKGKFLLAIKAVLSLDLSEVDPIGWTGIGVT